MILTNSKSLDNKFKSLRNLCFVPNERFVHYELGWNYRMTNLDALGLGQLRRLKEIVKRKKEVGKLYNKYLKNNNLINLPLERTSYAENIYWVYGITIKKSKI